MASGVTISYGGYSTFSHVRINSYVHAVDAGPERAQRGPTRHTIEGTAILKAGGSNPSNIEDAIAEVTAIFGRNGLALRITTTEQDGATDHDIVDVPEGDDRTGPYPHVTINEVIGANAVATVSWSFEWYVTEQSGATLSPVREFVCTTTFDIDHVGMTTMTRSGYIILTKQSAGTTNPTSVASWPTASAKPSLSGSGYGYASTWNRKDAVLDYPISGTSAFTPTLKFPEQYRRLAAGNLYPGFRRVSQRYATDESRSRMMFEVVDREASRKLPSPARVCDVDFSYEREIASADKTAMGVKTFRCTVQAATGVSPVDLLTLAVRVSQNRIFWSRTKIGSTYYEPDIIQRIAVHEHAACERNALTLEVSAIATANPATSLSGTGSQAVQQGQPYRASGMLGDILTDLSLQPVLTDGTSSGSAITFTFTAATMPDAYGDFGVYRITPSWYDPEQETASQTWTTTQVLAAADKSNATYVFPDQVFTTVISDGAKTAMGRDNAKIRRDQAVGAPSADGTTSAHPILYLKSHKRNWTETSVVSVPSQSLQGASLSFQTRKPRTFQHERIVCARLNKAPDREFLSKPSGGIVLHEDFVTTGGTTDEVSNRIMAAVYERVVEIPDGGGSTSGPFYTGGTGSAFRQAWPNKLADDANITGSHDPGDAPLPKMATRDYASGDEQFIYPFGDPESWA